MYQVIFFFKPFHLKIKFINSKKATKYMNFDSKIDFTHFHVASILKSSGFLRRLRKFEKRKIFCFDATE